MSAPARLAPLVGLVGFKQQTWPSLNRTLAHVRGALQRSPYRFSSLPENEPWFPLEQPDLAIGFSGYQVWEAANVRQCPSLIFMHGGAVLDHNQLSEYANLLRPSDGFIVTCKSD